jgi:hypothetical protein
MPAFMTVPGLMPAGGKIEGAKCIESNSGSQGVCSLFLVPRVADYGIAKFELFECISKLGAETQKQGYPQNLWITLWKTLSQTCQKGVLSGSLLFWLNLNHTSFTLINS